ncbi:MAG: YfiR family protein [Myxococcaceae bacterium]|nr:YfiR family protein [Myxococcaceae bacterium]
MSRAIALAVALSSGLAHAQAEAPVKLGALLLLKLVTYDAAFDTRGDGDFVLAVPYSKGREGEAEALVKALLEVETRRLKQRPLVFRALPVEKADAEALLVSAALVPSDLAALLSRAREKRRYTFGLSEAAAREGALLAVTPNEGKLKPVLNVSTARAIGAEFPASVLKLARVVQDG